MSYLSIAYPNSTQSFIAYINKPLQSLQNELKFLQKFYSFNIRSISLNLNTLHNLRLIDKTSIFTLLIRRHNSCLLLILIWTQNKWSKSNYNPGLGTHLWNLIHYYYRGFNSLLPSRSISCFPLLPSVWQAGW